MVFINSSLILTVFSFALSVLSAAHSFLRTILGFIVADSVFICIRKAVFAVYALIIANSVIVRILKTLADAVFLLSVTNKISSAKFAP